VVARGKEAMAMLIDEIRRLAEGIPAALKEEKGEYLLEVTVAERKAFLSRKSLIYSVRFRIDEEKKELRFTEMLRETGSGLSTGNVDTTPGFGFRKETYKTGAGPREATIEEQSRLFGARYSYTFDFSRVRRAIEAEAMKAGCTFSYQITRRGLRG
jgi:hypothetical protein